MDSSLVPWPPGTVSECTETGETPTDPRKEGGPSDPRVSSAEHHRHHGPTCPLFLGMVRKGQKASQGIPGQSDLPLYRAGVGAGSTLSARNITQADLWAQLPGGLVENQGMMGTQGTQVCKEV